MLCILKAQKKNNKIKQKIPKFDITKMSKGIQITTYLRVGFKF